IRADGLRVCCMALIPCGTTPGRVRTSSKLSQSQNCTPNDISPMQFPQSHEFEQRRVSPPPEAERCNSLSWAPMWKPISMPRHDDRGLGNYFVQLVNPHDSWLGPSVPGDRGHVDRIPKSRQPAAIESPGC